MTVCITGSTGFIGAHVAKLAAEAYGPPRITYRDEQRLGGWQSGLVTFDGKRKPSFAAFRRAAAQG